MEVILLSIFCLGPFAFLGLQLIGLFIDRRPSDTVEYRRKINDMADRSIEAHRIRWNRMTPEEREESRRKTMELSRRIDRSNDFVRFFKNALLRLMERETKE